MIITIKPLFKCSQPDLHPRNVQRMRRPLPPAASAVTISRSLIGMKRAAQSAVARKRGPPIMPADISFRGTHAGSPGSDLHGLASLTGTCPAECRFSDAYSGSGGACGERGGRTFTGTCSQKKKRSLCL